LILSYSLLIYKQGGTYFLKCRLSLWKTILALKMKNIVEKNLITLHNGYVAAVTPQGGGAIRGKTGEVYAENEKDCFKIHKIFNLFRACFFGAGAAAASDSLHYGKRTGVHTRSLYGKGQHHAASALGAEYKCDGS
jgi:hypothetical protein